MLTRLIANFYANPLVWICGAILILLIIISVVNYLIRGASFKKGEFGKELVENSLKRYASSRDMTVLSNVSVSDGEETVTFENVLVGYFGLLFVQSIQGGGSFWGDGKEEQWAFTDGDSKIIFKNPILEQEEKIKVFRRVLAKKKIYNVPLESTVVLATMGKEPKLYMSNIGNMDAVLTESMFKNFLQQDKFEQDKGIDKDAIIAIFNK